MSRKLFITVIALSLFVFVAKQSADAVCPKRNPLPSDYATGLSWQDAQKSDKPMVINFYVDWCGACKRFAPIFEKYNKQYGSDYNFVIVKADCPKNREFVKDFHIPGYPTVYLYSLEQDKKVRLKPEQSFVEEEFKKELKSFSEDNYTAPQK